MKTNSILEEIRTKSYADICKRIESKSFESLRKSALERDVGANFKNALKNGGGNPAVIAELKKASPSQGIIREDLCVVELATALEKSGASALSVLTEKNYFMGSLDNLFLASRSVKIPVLCKDFIFCEFQICEAAVNGASAVLLIAKMLGAENFARLFKFAKTLSLDVLAEAHDEAEIEMLAENGADIVGVNCRNLDDFSTDFSVSERLLKFVPNGIVRVAESGVGERQTLLRARDAGADAVLIGSSLMRATCPSKKLLSLLGK